MKESDWKTFRGMVVDLRERYLERKNQHLKAMLDAPGKTPTDRFWDTLEAMQHEARILQRCLDRHSRSNMDIAMLNMLNAGMLQPADLEKFSPELRKSLGK